MRFAPVAFPGYGAFDVHSPIFALQWERLPAFGAENTKGRPETGQA